MTDEATGIPRIDLRALELPSADVTLPGGRDVQLRAPTMGSYATWKRIEQSIGDGAEKLPVGFDAEILAAVRQVLPDDAAAAALTLNPLQILGLLRCAVGQAAAVEAMIAALHAASSSGGNADPTTPSPEALPGSDSGPLTSS